MSATSLRVTIALSSNLCFCIYDFMSSKCVKVRRRPSLSQHLTGLRQLPRPDGLCEMEGPALLPAC